MADDTISQISQDNKTLRETSGNSDISSNCWFIYQTCD